MGSERKEKREPDLLDRPPLVQLYRFNATRRERRTMGEDVVTLGLDENGDVWQYIPKRVDGDGEVIEYACWLKWTRRAKDATRPGRRRLRARRD